MCEVGIQHPAEESGRKSSRTVVRFRQLFFHRIFAWGEKATQRFNLSQVGVCILDAAGRIFVRVRFFCEILRVSARFCEILSFHFCCIYDIGRSRAVGKVVDHDGPHTQNKLLLILLLLVFRMFSTYRKSSLSRSQRRRDNARFSGSENVRLFLSWGGG